MKYIKIILLTLVAVASLACQPQVEGPFEVQTGSEDGKITMGPEGGYYTIDIKSSDNWVVETGEPWILVSPANGKGNVQCQVSVDSTLVTEVRKGKIRIRTLSDNEVQDVDVLQKGFEYQIVLDKTSKEIDDFAALESRSFDVEVKTMS